MLKFAPLAALSATGSLKLTMSRPSVAEPLAAVTSGGMVSPGRTKTWRMRVTS